MSMVSHADVIGIVLFLILGAVSYYFYARISQLERKVGLMENILFDLKLTTEQAMNLLTEPDEEPQQRVQESKPVSWSTPFSSSQTDDVIPASTNPADTKELSVSNSSRVRTPPQSLQVERNQESSEDTAAVSSGASVTPNYEAMTYKELTQLAKQRGLTGLRNASKAQVIEALRGESNSSSKQQTKTLDISSWMQDATPLQDRQQSEGLDAVESGDMGGTLLDSNEVDASLVGEN
jgi:outer membrane scaffolding protein for murein synthesis (MipA/OmpV family)